MAKLGPTAAFLTLIALAGAGKPPPRSAPDTVSVSRRVWMGVCTGVCPDYTVTVESSGRAWALRRRFDAPDQLILLHVSRRAGERFRNILEPYRPHPGDPEITECEHNLSADEAPLLVKTIEIEVKWSGPRGSAHLIACNTDEYRRLKEAIDEALDALGLGITAFPKR